MRVVEIISFVSSSTSGPASWRLSDLSRFILNWPLEYVYRNSCWFEFRTTGNWPFQNLVIFDLFPFKWESDLWKNSKNIISFCKSTSYYNLLRVYQYTYWEFFLFLNEARCENKRKGTYLFFSKYFFVFFFLPRRTCQATPRQTNFSDFRFHFRGIFH